MSKKKQCGLPCSCMRMVVSSLLLAISVHSPDKIVTFYNILSKNILNIANNLKLPPSSCFKLLQNINLYCMVGTDTVPYLKENVTKPNKCTKFQKNLRRSMPFDFCMVFGLIQHTYRM